MAPIDPDDSIIENLTPKQKKVLDFIRKFQERKGYAPSQREIAERFKFKSLGTVQNYLVRLERHGALQKTWNAKRSLKLRSRSTPQEVLTQAVPLPLVGEVAAGYPIEAIEDTRTVEVPLSMLRGGNHEDHMVLKVKGDSMIEDGVLEGDYVVIKRQPTAHNGQTVVALVGNEATIKRFYRKKMSSGSRIELHPANPAYDPIIVENMVDGPEAPPEFKLEGVLVGVLRTYE